MGSGGIANVDASRAPPDRVGALLMMPMQMPEDQTRALCERVHEKVMKDCAEATPPNLDEEERLCKQVQFVTHMRYFLSDATTIMNERLLRFDGSAVEGTKYDDTMRSARRYARMPSGLRFPIHRAAPYNHKAHTVSDTEQNWFRPGTKARAHRRRKPRTSWP